VPFGGSDTIKFTLDEAALLIVDMQVDFVHGPMAVAGAPALAARLQPLLSAWRRSGLPVIYTVEAHRPGGGDLGYLARFDPLRAGVALVEGTPGAAVVPELAPAPDETVVTKRRFSGFCGTDLELALRSRGVTRLFIAGVATHVCCDTTGRDAAQLNFATWLLSDGTSCGDLPDLGWGPVPAGTVHQVVFTLFAHRFGAVCRIADLLDALAARRP